MSLLRRLIAGRDVLILVIGEKGSGKTTLLNHCLDTFRKTWKVCRIRISGGNSGNVSTATRLLKYPAYVIQNDHHQTVIIDDAHLIEPAALEIILRKLAKAEQSGKVNHLVLFGEHPMSANLAAIDKTIEAVNAVNRIFMPALTQTETTAYLRHRYSIIGHTDLRLFNKRVAKKIHLSSGGLPGQINTEADLWLQKHDNKNLQNAPNRKPADGGRLRRFLNDVTAAGKLLSAGTLLHPGRTDSSPKFQESTSSRLMSPDGIKTGQGRRQQPDAGRKESVLQISGTSSASGQVSKGTNGTHGAFCVPMASATFPSVSIEALPPGKAAAIQHNIYRENWLLCQDPACYTIQVLGAKSEKAIAAIVKSHRLPAHRKIACFRTSYRGETAYPLLWGVYRTQSEATAAVKELPGKLKAFFPLIRRISAIHKVIRASDTP